MGNCFGSKQETPVSPDKSAAADAAPTTPGGEEKPKRQRRPSHTAIETNVDLTDQAALDNVMAQIMEDSDDLADFQAFALDKSSEEEINLWTDIDEYVKQFAICDDDEGDTDEEKLTRKLEVERLLNKHFCDGGPGTKLKIAPETVAELKSHFGEANYHTTIWFPVRSAIVHDMAIRQLKPYIEHQRLVMRSAGDPTSPSKRAHADKRREGSRIARKSANARFDKDMHDALKKVHKDRQTMAMAGGLPGGANLMAMAASGGGLSPVAEPNSPTSPGA